MSPPSPVPTALVISDRLAAIFIALIFLTACSVNAEAPPTWLSIRYNGTDFEGRQTFQLEWNAFSNATYLVQSAASLDPESPWKTLDVVVPTAGTYVFDLVVTDNIGLASLPRYYRLVLPQPQIFTVEPAVVAPGATVDLHVVGQCFSSNDVLRINGVTQSNVVFNSSTLLTKPTFTPGSPGTYTVTLVVAGVVQSSFTVTCADAFADPELVLQGPPDEPLAAPRKTGFMPMGIGGTNMRGSGGGGDDCDDNDPAVGLTAAQCDYFAEKDKVTICHRTSSARNPYNIIRTSTAGCRGAGSAVEPFSGEVRQQVVDLAVEGRGLDFIWARTYNSRIGQDTPQGSHWSHSYDIHLQPLGGDFLIHDGTGRRDLFRLQTNGTYTCPEFFREGTMTGGVFRLTFADTGYWEFNPLVGSLNDGKLVKIVDRNSNTMSLNYDTSGQLTQIVDDLDRTNTVAYDTDGHVASVTDFSGRTVTYQYYHGLPGEPGGAGDLASVTSPPVTGTPNTNDFPLGKTTTYTYSSGYLDDRENHLLLSTIDATGEPTHEFIYQHNQSDWDFLRCVSIKRGTNTPTIITYLPQTALPSNQFATLRCVVNNPVGDVTECFYDARNRRVKLEEFTGRATPDVAVTATVNRPTGKLRSTDPDSYVTKWTWNADSLCTLEVLPDGERTQMIYRQDFGQANPRQKADLMVVREYPCCNGADSDGDGTSDLTERVWRYEYDPRFGTGEHYGGRKIWDRLGDWGGKIEGGGGGGPTKGWDGRSGNMRDRLDALESKLQAFGLLARFGSGPRQSTSLDGSWASADSIDVRFGSGLGRTDVQDVELRYSAPTSRVDPRGNVTTGSYDTNGNLTNLRYKTKDGAIIAADFNYKERGRLTAITNAPDANGYRRVDTFDYYTNGPQAGYCRQFTVDTMGPTLIAWNFEYDSRGNLTRLIDPRTNDWLYTWNALDQCVLVQTPTNIVSRCATDFRYDANDNLVQFSTEVRDAGDNFTHHTLGTCEWQDITLVGRVVIQVSTNQFHTNEFVYDGNGQCVLMRGGDAVSGANPHHMVSFQYDECGLLYRTVTAPGSPVQSTTQFDYDSNGNPIRVSEGLEGTPSITTMEYDGFAGFGSSSSQTDCRSGEGCGNGRAGLRAAGPTPLAGSIRTARLAKITDALGNQTTFNFDANDNLKVVRHFGQTNDVTGTNGNIRLAESRYEYDALNRRLRSHNLFFDVSTQSPIGDGERTTTFAYAPNGQCTSVTDDLGRTTTFAYDTVGRASSVTSPGSKTIVVTVRDQYGNATRTTQTDLSDLGGPPQVFTRTNVYDSLNRCISTTDNVGNSDLYAYDSLSRVVKHTDPRGIRNFYTYDLLGRRTMAVRDLDDDGLPDLAYDYSERTTWSTSNGRLLSTSDSHSNTTFYGYDSAGHCTSITNADGTRMALVWSPRSNLISEQDANGTMIVHTYDQNDRCISNYITPGAGVATTTTFETYAYDGCSRLVAATNDASHSEFDYDSHGNLQGNHADGWNVLHADDSMGRRTSLMYPGGRTLTYAYDALDQCTNIVESGASLASYAYDGPGRVARVTYGNGMRTRIFYDGISGTPNVPGDFGHGQVSRIRHAVGGAAPIVSEVSHLWDRNQNKTARTDTIFAPAIPRTNDLALAYDAADRLTEATLHSGSTLLRDTIYGLDRMGNRSNVIGAASCSGSYFMDGLVPGPMDFQMNQYTTTPCDSRSYDEKGNLVSRSSAAGPVTYQYDYAGRLVLVQAFDSGSGTLAPLASYAYDALGRRISKTVFGSSGLPPVTTTFIYDGSGVIEEREAGLVTKSFVLDGSRSQDDGVIQMRHSGQDYYFHTDDLGNTLALTTTGGAVAERYDYDDYGAVTFLTSDGIPTSATSSAVGNVYCWGGLRLDSETGLQNNDGGGYFEPQTGRTYTGLKRRLASDRERFGGLCFSPSGNNPWSGGGGGAFLIKNRTDLKAEFQNGDIPDQNDFADAIDSSLNLVDDGLISYSAKVPRPVLKEYFHSGDKPTQSQFGALIDSVVNKPWTGGSPNAMKSGTVKFFNQAKGFGRVIKSSDGGVIELEIDINALIR